MKQSLEKLNEKYQNALKDLRTKDEFVFTYITSQEEVQDINRIIKIYKEMI